MPTRWGLSLMSNELANYALHYAENGIPVLPLHWIKEDGVCSCGGFLFDKNGNVTNKPCAAGKHPRSINGLTDATTDKNIIKKWWDKWPNANIGAACGFRFDVIDVDPRNGGNESINGDEESLGKLLHQHTGQGGSHYLVKPGSHLKKRPGVDMLTRGKYIVVEPSLTTQHYYFDDWEVLTDPLPALIDAPSVFIEIQGSHKPDDLVKPRIVLSVDDIRLLRSALNYFDSDDYDRWIKFGQCLKELGAVGRGLFFDWSESYERFDRAECQAKWAGFQGDNAGYRGILKEAYSNGWDGNKKSTAKSTDEVTETESPALTTVSYTHLTLPTILRV